MLKQDTSFIIICYRVLVVWVSKKQAEINIWKHLFRKHRFCEHWQKNIEKTMVFNYSNLHRPIRNQCQNAFEKTSEKHLPEIDVDLHLGLRKPPRIPRKSTWTRKTQTKPVLRRYGKRSQVVAKQRAAEVWDYVSSYSYD